jgi:hypothetical protein
MVNELITELEALNLRATHLIQEIKNATERESNGNTAIRGGFEIGDRVRITNADDHPSDVLEFLAERQSEIELQP